MSYQSERPNRSSRPLVVLLTIALQIALAMYLYQAATSAEQPGRTKIERVEKP